MWAEVWVCQVRSFDRFTQMDEIELRIGLLSPAWTLRSLILDTIMGSDGRYRHWSLMFGVTDIKT